MKCEKWYKRFSVEFSLGDSPTPEPPPFLLNAKTNRGEKVAAWIKDYMNQRSRYPSGIQKQAKSMDDFCKSVGDPPPEDLPKLVRDIWQAIDDFSKSVDGDSQDFRKLIAGQLNGWTPPPPDYETLTAKDADRLEKIQNILASKEFGTVVTGRDDPFGKVQSDWKIIRDRIKDGHNSAKTRSDNDSSKSLLDVLGRAFRL